MQSGNPFQAFVARYADLLAKDPVAAHAEPIPARAKVTQAPNSPKIVIFSPHPDDECIVGALPLRLQRELAAHVINVAVTLGSKEERRTARRHELRAACGLLGFDVFADAERALEKINVTTRSQQPQLWSGAVARIAEIITEQRPMIVMLPHESDWHSTHIGTHYLVTDALAQLPLEFRCWVVETEFWGAMKTPNLLVESSLEDVADLIAALSLHRGEVERNPYHLRLPAWMIDNVRRGAELVSGQGEAAPDFTFATLYKVSRWTDGRLVPLEQEGLAIAQNESLGDVFDLSS